MRIFLLHVTAAYCNLLLQGGFKHAGWCGAPNIPASMHSEVTGLKNANLTRVLQHELSSSLLRNSVTFISIFVRSSHLNQQGRQAKGSCKHQNNAEVRQASNVG
jgi:hypothetical protein